MSQPGLGDFGVNSAKQGTGKNWAEFMTSWFYHVVLLQCGKRLRTSLDEQTVHLNASVRVLQRTWT